ncbi:MAG TPA: helix-turn-helix domain-containing protein [Candidatus Paceibacterota bacterium]|jgi:DNA-binding HxlR family transcriptional regulator|nr:helix-turn-helix domain-containing protein [Candidatus Paceibacterota bacterium]
MDALAPCPVQKTATLLSDTWTMLIIRDLLEGPRRFCELERSLEGISTRTLTLKLKKLESERLVKKLKNGSYCATPRGKGLRAVELAMRRYGEKYL